MAILPGVLGCCYLRRTIQARLGTNPLRLPGGTPIFAVSRRQFIKHPGWIYRAVCKTDCPFLCVPDVNSTLMLHTHADAQRRRLRRVGKTRQSAPNAGASLAISAGVGLQR
ncbi:MAG: hypothetical protein OEU80_03925 [Deltaproteobacteria bacterium]|nr:hypothetical protein [Deltaproteobacteria bacterium]